MSARSTELFSQNAEALKAYTSRQQEAVIEQGREAVLAALLSVDPQQLLELPLVSGRAAELLEERFREMRAGRNQQVLTAEGSTNI